MSAYRRIPRLSPRCLLALLVGACAVIASSAYAQAIDVRGGNQTLNIITGTAGAGGTMTSVVNTASTIRYRKQAAVSRITVQTACPGQSFSLAVVATGVTRGVAQPEVNLVDGMAAVNLITSIPRTGFWTTATITLRYTASATFAQGNSAENGNDVHTVTYTILAP